ncbi:MAG: hypothetical protein BGO01_15790 [Armatimonadetes bacterium 55-13]|nr:amidohydrolase [Armatimonadota bacterium]OJU65322.1 MAG: hypothetical protein BGO01_15790 [Armatimonadetes bacterium 55-13]
MIKLYRDFIWWRTGERQSMLVEGDRVIWRGHGEAPHAEVVDLSGKTLYPAFIDNHCHILPTGLDLQKLHLGACQTHQDVLDAVRDRLAETTPGKWLLAVHYDQTRYEGGRHLTRFELDQVSPSVPILLRHVNGHASVANSAALQAAGIPEDVENPAGGTFDRDSSSRLSGVLLESAHELVTHKASMPSLDEMVDAILTAGNHMASLGISGASDMMTGRFDLLKELRAYDLAAQRGCRIRTRLYLQWGEVFRKDGNWRSPEVQSAIESYGDKIDCRIAGIKIFADGAIGSATAAIYGHYSGAEPAGHAISHHARDASQHAPEGKFTSGQLIYSPERLKEMVRIADQAGFSIAIHSIGDYSTDLVMDAFESLPDPRKHRIEHAMLLSDAQIERLGKLGCFCTMQPEFLMRFGHSYLRQLGPVRASKLERFRSVKDAGIPLSLSSDRPIVAGDPRDGVKMAHQRPEAFDSSENLTLEEAIDGYTTRAAEPTNDSALMGGLNPGQLAEFRVE